MKVTVWTATTEGNNCPVTTTVHATESDALRRVLADLDLPPNWRGSATNDQVCTAWSEHNDGPCIIEEHAVEI